jgi:diguanylate cyclase (GGDEF)-like protein/PAS domain S-box-containing protein
MTKPDISELKLSAKSQETGLDVHERTIAELKQLQEALKVSEDNYFSLIEHNADGIVVLNSHTIEFVNHKLYKLTGYSQDEIIGKQFIELVPLEYQSLLKENYEMKLISGEPNALEMEIVIKDGRKIPVETRAQPIEFKGKTATMVVIRDVSKRKQAEDALKLSEKNFRTSMDASSIGIRISDNNNNNLYVNQAFMDIFGYENMDEIKASPPPEHYTPESHASWVLRHEKLLRGAPMPKRVDIDVLRKDGSVRHLDVSMKEVFWDGKQENQTLYNDVTEMKQLEEETKRTNERLTSLVKKLEEQQRQSAILAEMRDMLQACSKMEETAPIIMGFMKKLFPVSQGALFLLSNSRSDLESIVTWGDFPVSPNNNVFPPDACWGLRRGRAHVVDDIKIGPICPHLENTMESPYVCLPLMAKGDILGLLHLKNAFNGGNSRPAEIADLRQMAVTLSEYLSLSIANVKLSESLSRQSIQDPQSGLYNRHFMEESLQREITRASRKVTPIGIIMGDLDHFKKFNDVYGHAAGDKIIAEIGKLFKAKFRGSDIACRYGGEEFLIILPETSLEDTFKRANGLREEIKKLEMVFQGQILGMITMSMGIAAYPEKGTRMEDLLRIADTALYKAKQEGRDRVISG